MKFANLDTAYNRVRQELCDAGLLADGVYLDEIELWGISSWGSWQTILRQVDGYVYDSGVGFLSSLFRFKSGVIYIPTHVPAKGQQYLEDVIRHEYAHAWRWLDPDYIAEPWFADAFGREYDSEDWPIGTQLFALLNTSSETMEEFRRLKFDQDFVTPYALSSPREDFAECFYHYIKAPDDICCYRHRKGVYRKLKAIEKAVKRKAKLLGTL